MAACRCGGRRYAGSLRAGSNAILDEVWRELEQYFRGERRESDRHRDSLHRVVNANGDLGGYGGGLWRKRILLDLERGQGRLPF